MSSTDRVVTAVENAPADGKIAALVTAIKFEVAAALKDARLPPDNDRALAAVFPDLEANHARLNKCFDPKHKPGEKYSSEKDTTGNRPGVQTHASPPANSTSAIPAGNAGHAVGGAGATPNDGSRVADRSSEPASDAQSLQGSASTSAPGKPVKSGSAKLATDGEK